ncbi:mechanosensitive ion channel family protein [Crocosphaera sp.]|uniref:mechanosensitive ion channel family protein n=1 Tax=Crocosphaera sp. TaxID=2729996 RepID=UPI00261CEB51|nr:mechanosensitive ion channel family protein [Crocosphaera sp.]MDJ0578863.1 mechanosensitive ion channel family protein [Crocosphaera sp.]
MPSIAHIQAISWSEISNQKQLPSQYILAQEKEQENNKYNGDNQESSSDNLDKKNYPHPVTLDGEIIFEYKLQVEKLQNKQRAEEASERVKDIANDRSISVEDFSIRDLKALELEGLRLIFADNKMILAITQADADVENQSLDELAESYLQEVKKAIIKYREERKLQNFILRGIGIILSTIVLIFIFRFLNWFFPWLGRQITRDQGFIFRNINIQNWNILTVKQEKRIALFILKLIRWFITLTFLYFYIPFLLSLFPQTERLANSIFSSFFGVLAKVWAEFIAYVPNLFLIVVTLIITHYLIRLCDPFFKAIEDERIIISGFYPDWAQPTYKLTVILICGLAAAIIFPYLPGFNSPAFQGISILAGALVTFGGASTIANLIAGFVVIYTRAFQLGDRIKVSEYRGVVIDKTILSTRICNGNNEIITIPNSILIASSIINYSATIRDLKEPLVIDTTITLGYDVPWRLVYETLINCALETTDILEYPEPYVWQTSLDDFYISYQLRVYTNKTKSVAIGNIYSELHQNIQDKCAEVGIEIMSPHYAAVRDGHQNTIPEDYLPKDYETPGFRLQPLKSFFKQNIEKDN